MKMLNKVSIPLLRRSSPAPPPLAEVLEVPLHLNRVRGIGPHLHEGLTDGFRDELLQLLVGHVVEAHAQASLSPPAASAIAFSASASDRFVIGSALPRANSRSAAIAVL